MAAGGVAFCSTPRLHLSGVVMEERLPNGVVMQCSEAQFRLSTDSMVLADFAAFSPKDKICDLGCGCGALTLLTAAVCPDVQLTGVEINPDAALAARQNVRRNALAERATILCGDLRDASLLPAGGFDGVICNPPYYPVASGFQSKSEALTDARSEQCCTLSELCRCASRILRWGGRFFIVHKPERLTDLLVFLRAEQLEPKRLRFVRHKQGSAVSLVLIEARRGGKSGLTVENNLILHLPDGSPSSEYRRIYHQED